MIQDVPTDEIAKRTGYSIHTIRHVFAELREKYGVNTKSGIITAYLIDRFKLISNQINDLILIADGANFSSHHKNKNHLDSDKKNLKK